MSEDTQAATNHFADPDPSHRFADPDPSHRFADPDPALTLGSTHAGFTVTRVEELPERRGWGYVFRHQTSGAQLAWIACDDTNRAFAIAFKTPPANSTGVFHILEHSVLDGSKRFPTKEPFVHLLKSSMQTFLNAITFPDKTMYPVSSTNKRDLENLMDVYLDAVFHPNIYTHPHIFEQEGWHLEVADNDEASLVYNGVVLNEMKGALSNPDEVLFETLCSQLFPDTCYQYDSGGNPRAITKLSYEEFLDTHARHYTPRNSYSFLYGDIDIEHMLSFVGTHLDSALERSGDKGPNKLCLQSPVTPEPIQVCMEISQENACLGIAYVLNANDRTTQLALSVLLDALMGSNEAPLKRHLLGLNLANDVVCMVVDGLLQPMLIFQLKGVHEGAVDTFRTELEAAAAELVKNGIPRDCLEASLARAEFALREHNYGSYSAGVYLAISAMSSWLHDDERPFEYLHYETSLKELSDGLATTYYEDLLNDVVCTSIHTAQVEVLPGQTGSAKEEAAELAVMREKLDDDDIAAISAKVEALRTEQFAPDTAEAIASLPRLHVSDIDEPAQEPPVEKLENEPLCVYHDIPTDHIMYVYHYFGLSNISWDELPYVTILTDVLGKLATSQHSALELDTLCGRELGNLSFFTEVVSMHNMRNELRPMFVVGASALSQHATSVATILQEIWSSTDFSDHARIHDILLQCKVAMEQMFISAGHSLAVARASSYFSPAELCRQQLSGIDYYLFLKDTLEHFDERADGIEHRLHDIAQRIFSASNLETSFTGSKEDYERWREAASDFSLTPVQATPASLTPTQAAPAQATPALIIPEPQIRNEAFVIPGDVCFVGAAFDAHSMGVVPHGSWSVCSRVISYDYLWDRVRKQGGAYGCGFKASTESIMQLYSYRDPAIDPTLAAYDEIAHWLATWQPSQEEFEGYIISSVASLDAPETARALMRRQDIQRLCKRPETWRASLRTQMLNCTLANLHEKAEILQHLAAKRGTCVFGNLRSIESSKAPLQTIQLMDSM